MAYIFIKGTGEKIQIPNPQALQIKGEMLTGQISKIVVEAGGLTIKGSEIKAVMTDDESKEKSVWDLSTEEIKAELGDFEEKFKSAKQAPLDNPVEWYGELWPEGGERAVWTNIWNGDAGVLQRLLDAGQIRRIESETGLGEKYIRYGIGTTFLNGFERKRQLLAELNSRRNYAKKMEAENLDKLAEAKSEALKKYTSEEFCEEDGEINPDRIPF